LDPTKARYLARFVAAIILVAATYHLFMGF